MSTRAPTADAIARQAAEWIVQLTDDDVVVRERARTAFDQWKSADPRHAEAADEIERMLGHVQAARHPAGGDSRPARVALDAAFGGARRRHKRTRTTLVILAALVLPIWLVLHVWPPSYLLADLRSGVGQWASHALTDGSSVTLGSATAVDLRYDDKERMVELVQGEILVDVVRDPARPFVVVTPEGRIRALGTRFVVERRDDSTVISMLESRVAVFAADNPSGEAPREVEVAAGDRVRIQSGAVSTREHFDVRELGDAWKFHHLVIDDRPMDEVLDELSRYRPGHIEYDREEVHGIRVSAVLPLDDTDQALALLSTSFPALRIRTLSPWLVWVDAPATD